MNFSGQFRSMKIPINLYILYEFIFGSYMHDLYFCFLKCLSRDLLLHKCPSHANCKTFGHAKTKYNNCKRESSLCPLQKLFTSLRNHVINTKMKNILRAVKELTTTEDN